MNMNQSKHTLNIGMAHSHTFVELTCYTQLESVTYQFFTLSLTTILFVFVGPTIFLHILENKNLNLLKHQHLDTDDSLFFGYKSIYG